MPRANFLPGKAATALLARAYLFIGDWKNAEAAASLVINDSNFSLVDDLNQVFLANSSEAILQLEMNTAFYPFNATTEGYTFVGYPGSPPNTSSLSSFLLNAFEPGDQRRIDWVDSTTFAGTTYYYPYKYKIGAPQATPNGAESEYYMVLRLGEQYLIRSEAEAHGAGSGISGAIADLNAIRNRAGLPNYTGSSVASSVLNAIYHENQIEFCFEWGHRWLDLRRDGQINSVMSIVTPQKSGAAWRPTQALYPIPAVEIQRDHYLTQNPGY
jgi:hypothetical protein